MAMAAEAVHAPFVSVFTAPPKPLPRYEQLDAPLLGNGDMAAALCGAPEDQQFWLSKNDLWELRPVWRLSGPRPFGHLDIQIPQLAGATYHVEQDLAKATTVATFRKRGSEVTMRSWVSATQNFLVVELSVTGPPVEGSVRLWVPSRARTVPQSDHRPPHITATDWVGMPSAPILNDGAGTFWGVRGFRENVTVPAETACAFRLLGGSGEHFILRPGTPVVLIAAMRSLRQSPQYVAGARAMVTATDVATLAALYKDHEAWWRDFWAKSSVDLGDPELEWRYHVSNYILASCSRDPDYPPGIAGTWVTTDQPMWTGAYTLNYNHEACFYGLYSSNHIEQADPEDAPVLAFRDRGEYYARAVFGCRGVLYPVKIGPVGVETTGDPAHPDTVLSPKDPPWLRQKGGLFLGQRSDAAFAAVNMAQRWYTTYDPAYARRIYPFIRDVALFWEDYPKFEPTPPALVQATRGLPDWLRQPPGGRYVDYKDGATENGQDTNPSLSLSLARSMLNLSIDLSTELQVDEGERAKWRFVLDHLSAMPTEIVNGRTLFRRAEVVITNAKKKPGDLQTSISPIYPAGIVSLGSDPRLLQIAQATFATKDDWVSKNGESAFFPAAARVGFNPATLLSKLDAMAFQPNGIVVNPMHMLENSSIVPNTVDEMLMQSHDGIIRLFPVWPRARDAAFHTLRAYGAFLVSARLSGGLVKDVTIYSEKGRPCVVENPWPGRQISLVRAGQPVQTLAGEQLRFQTAPGDSIELKSIGPP